MSNIARIEEKLDVARAGAVEVSADIGGVRVTNMAEVMEFAKLMSLAGVAVPKHLQGQPGTCLAVCIQALEWKFSPFAVANKSYSVNDRLAFEAQLIHAVVLARAPLEGGGLDIAFEGEGAERICVVKGTVIGGTEKEYRSPKFAAINPKNSPLWKNDPDQQLAYFSVRGWSRRHMPHVLLGVYSRDELQDGTVIDAEALEAGGPAAPSAISQKLTGQKKRGRPPKVKPEEGAQGFSEEHVERHTNGNDGGSALEGAKVQETPHDADGVVIDAKAEPAKEAGPKVAEPEPEQQAAAEPEEDADAGDGAPAREQEREPTGMSKLLSAYAEATMAAKSANQLKTAVDGFWNSRPNDYPHKEDDTDENREGRVELRKRIGAIFEVQKRRVQGEVDNKGAWSEIQEWIYS